MFLTLSMMEWYMMLNTIIMEKDQQRVQQMDIYIYMMFKNQTILKNQQILKHIMLQSGKQPGRTPDLEVKSLLVHMIIQFQYGKKHSKINLGNFQFVSQNLTKEVLILYNGQVGSSDSNWLLVAATGILLFLVKSRPMIPVLNPYAGKLIRWE